MATELRSRYARLLSIAGSDSGGGAGIQADLKTFGALGCYGMTAITAVTAQNTCGVSAIHPVPSEVLAAQIDAVAQDIGVDAVKIGMLPGAQAMQTVARALDRHQFPVVVLDPLMAASSGESLMDASAQDVIVGELFPRATLITPNLDEAGWFVGQPITAPEDMARGAQALVSMGARAVLLKGGHLSGNQVSDLLLIGADEPIWMHAPRIDTPNTHGTGCTLSSAIAAYLALGEELNQAVRLARNFVRDALTAAAGVRCGQGTGPLNHGHAPTAMRLLR